MKTLTVAICLDDAKGISFGGRRQSRDRVLIADFLKTCESLPICVSEYSKPLFGDAPRLTVASDPLALCADGGACFVETPITAAQAERIGTLIVYHWNRLYPSDCSMDWIPEERGFRLLSKTEFEGSSHQTITKEIYQKCERA